MHRGRVVADGVLPAKVDAGRVLHHVVATVRIAGNDGRGQVVVVVPRGTCAYRVQI